MEKSLKQQWNLKMYKTESEKVNLTERSKWNDKSRIAQK